MGLDSVVTLALGLGTGGTAEKSLRPDPRLEGLPSMAGLWSKTTIGLGSHQAPRSPTDSGGQYQGPLSPLGPQGQAREQRASSK